MSMQVHYLIAFTKLGVLLLVGSGRTGLDCLRCEVARDVGLSRESLYKALSGERSPGFDTILKVIDTLGLKLHAQAVIESAKQGALNQLSLTPLTF